MTHDTSMPATTSGCIKFPYEVSYIKRRGRKETNVRLPGLVDVDFRTIVETEAPVAFVVCAGDSQKKSNSFEVREFDGACWWPASYDEDFMSTQQFIDALANGDLRYLTLLFGTRINRDYSPGHWTWRRFEDLNERVILSNTHDADRQRMKQGAEDFLICGNRVFVKGLDPVYCCTVSEFELLETRFTVDIADPNRRPLSVEHPRARPLGNGADSFSSSSREGTVFRADEKERLADFLESRGLSREFPANIEVMLPRSIRSNPLQMQVAAQVQSLSGRIDLRNLPLESDHFKPLVMAHARLRSVAKQEQIEIDEGASALAALSLSRKRIDAVRKHDPELARTLAELQKPLLELVKRVRECCGSLPNSTTFLDKRDEDALRGLGA